MDLLTDAAGRLVVKDVGSPTPRALTNASPEVTTDTGQKVEVTVASSKVWRLKSIHAELETDVGVGNRQMALMADDAPANPVHPKRHFLRRAEPLPRDIPDDDLAIFLLMFRCGLRVGEVRGLSLSDLTLTPHSASLPRMRLTSKGRKERVVYLSTQPLAALQAWLEIHPHNSPSQAVFLNKFGRRLSVTGIQDRLAKYCRKAGLWVTCHQLRHTFGRHLTEVRVPVTTIQKLLGHARLRTTELYLHLADPVVQADYEAAMATIMAQLAPEGGAS